MVGFNTGGAYDPYARVFARHLPQPPAGLAPRRHQEHAGRGLGHCRQPPLQCLPARRLRARRDLRQRNPRSDFGSKNARFDARKFAWLGSAVEEIGGCFAWHTAPFKTVEDLFKEMVTGVTAPGSSSFDFPAAMNAVLGTRMKLVRGYKGAADLLLAVERGEVQGMCGMVNSTLGTQKPDWLAEDKARILVQFGLERRRA